MEWEWNEDDDDDIEVFLLCLVVESSNARGGRWFYESFCLKLLECDC